MSKAENTGETPKPPRSNWKITVGEGVRRLPVYLLLDCSKSMEGAPIQAVRRGIELFVEEVRGDALARQTVHVAVITFGSQARLVTNGLVPVEEFQVPDLATSGRTALGKALRALQESIDAHVKVPIRNGQKGDYKPLVFILTDGEPDEGWREAHREIQARAQRKVIKVVTVGCGPYINEDQLRAIAIGSSAFMMDDSEPSFRAFFKWVSQTVLTVSRTISQPGASQQSVSIERPPSNLFFHVGT